jgi:hypothetical protein
MVEKQHKTPIFRVHVLKLGRPLISGEVVVLTLQTSGLEGLQNNGDSRLLGASGRRRQLNLIIKTLETSMNQNSSSLFPVGRGDS